MATELPLSIARYVEIANTGDPEAAAQCFAPDAIVRDEGQIYSGLPAIKAWMAETKRKYDHTMTPLGLTRPEGKVVLSAKIAGNFPGSPVTLPFRFVLDGEGRIASLEIGS